jgi:ferritin-like metal-binding protein YciE
MESMQDVVNRYLEDAIAAEKNFETQLLGFAKEGEQSHVQRLFAQHADETRTQYERLTARLEALGGSTSTAKSFLAHVIGMSPKTAQVGHDEAERSAQDLMIAYAVENAEVAMYESLATGAAEAGDSETEKLARTIQQEERQTAEKVWMLLAPSARETFRKLAGDMVRHA